MIFIERMTVLGSGLIFQLVLASLPYTQTCTYNSDSIVTLQTKLTLQIFFQNYLIKKYKNREKERDRQTDRQTETDRWRQRERDKESGVK